MSLSVAALDELLRAPAVTADPGAEWMTRALVDAGELAREAYAGGQVEARLHAERLLHTIQVRSHFAPPLPAIPAIYWNILLRAKLQEEIFTPAGEVEQRYPDLGAGELRTRLEDAVAALGCHNHPLLDHIAGDATGRARLVFVKNWYGSCQGFSHQLIQLVQRTTGKARGAIAENVSDELAGVGHDELRLRFIESVGFRYDAQVAATDPDRVPESYALMSFRTGLCLLPNTLFALGSFYTTEANWPPECKRMLVGLRARGSNEHDLEYWTVHAFADEHHAAEWLDVLLETAVTPRERSQVLTGAMAQLRLRRRMYDTMLERLAR